MDLMDLDVPDIPGGDDFTDVTDLFAGASDEMEPDTVLLADTFGLQEAMSAFEIGEPRLDSGMMVDPEKEAKEPFDPLAPLLPQEVCWIMDRAFQYEMEWHAGNLLAHTVLTLRYAHQLGDMDADLLPLNHPSLTGRDPPRPIILVTLVLKAAVAGLLKCCDLSWRKMNAGILYDTEDWHSDKFEVSLLEGLQPEVVCQALTDAIRWTESTRETSRPWHDALRARLELRLLFLRLLASDIHRDGHHVLELITKARERLAAITDLPLPSISPDSVAHRAFDPYMARRFVTSIPLRVIELPPIGETYSIFGSLLDMWAELFMLSQCRVLKTWEIVGNTGFRQPGQIPRQPFIRSCFQLAFCDNKLVFGRENAQEVTELFFLETIGISWSNIKEEITKNWGPIDRRPAFQPVEDALFPLIVAHVQSAWMNPPRRRRYFMKSLLDWHRFDDLLSFLWDGVRDEAPEEEYLSYLSHIAQHYELDIARQIALSGFQQELYSMEEKVYAYWHTARILEDHLDILDDLLYTLEGHCAQEAFDELQFQRQFLNGLQLMCLGMVHLLTSFDGYTLREVRDKIEHSHLKRWKWYHEEYRREDQDAMPLTVPYLDSLKPFLNSRGDVQKANECFALGHSILMHPPLKGYAGSWHPVRTKLLQKLAAKCNELQKPGLRINDLAWAPHHDPWFPVQGDPANLRVRSV